MDGLESFALATAGWHVVQALPLLFSPTVIITLLSADVHAPADLEIYFARSTAFALLALSLLFVAISGVIPLNGTLQNAAGASDPPTASEWSPYLMPALITATLYHATVGFYSYACYNSTANSTFLIATMVSGGLAALGLWVTMFGQGSHISRRTGADKRTSGWPFGNAEADKKRVPKKRL